ncbi:uncharacterized protein LOC129755512 isoform X4 [Uranotaenia lowii]|uniref:uncharacterized protein LOC129755512 isoform X4 n=1 Tax=Uranotaenia lowii TaxID=190385 RepID=UPI002479C738|nr:uncharacterized protein LOC129755512 isoform X4 [Uranotaenia lowii]
MAMISRSFYKLMCYVAASFNIMLVLEIITEVVLPARHSEANVLASPCLANLILAVLLIFGVWKRIPSFIKIFKIFMYLQMAFLLIIAIYCYRLVVHGAKELRTPAHGAAMLIGLFGLESLIASGGLEAISSEPRPAGEGTVTFQQFV